MIPAKGKPSSRGADAPGQGRLDPSVHGQIFEPLVGQSPDALALVRGDQRMTYGELNRRANQLAHRMRRVGVGPESLVGLCMNRSLDLVVGIFGILKAGGAYVPMDPADPMDRLAFIVRDTRMSFLVTRQESITRLPNPPVHNICLDRDRREISQESEANPVGGLTGENLAYCIYTSGTTGVPKGVLICHRGLYNTTRSDRVFGIQPGDRVLHYAPFTFDAATHHMLLALARGATLCMTDSDPASILEVLRAGAISHMSITPSALAALPREPFPELKTILVGGEACPASLVEDWGRGRRFFNVYGPTETTIVATVAECVGDGSSPSIGRPIRNTHAYVLDGHDQPVPTGTPGELHIAGPGLARGYLNDPERTDWKFVFISVGDTPAVRMYKTGDRCQVLPNGEIEFLGRVDEQVKIRGFRVEPAEIETVLCRHPAVAECVVVPRKHPRGARALGAFVVEAMGMGASPKELRSYLLERLPAYMTPSSYQFLDALPLNRHGKVDRAALADLPRGSARTTTKRHAAPNLPWERELSTLFEEALGHGPIPVDADFFDLGGDSLSAVHLLTRFSQRYGGALSLSDIAGASTVRHLAKDLRDNPARPVHGRAVLIRPGSPKRSPLFCVPHGHGTPFDFVHVARAAGASQAFWGIELSADLWEGSIEGMAAELVREIREVQPAGPYNLMGSCFGGLVAYEAAQQLVAGGKEVSLLAVLDTPAPGFHYLKASSFERLRWHLLHQGHLGAGQRLSNVRERFMNVIRRFRDPLYHESYEVRESHVRRLSAYSARPYPGTVCLFRSEMSPAFPVAGDPFMGWPALAEGGLEIVRVPGAPSTMLRQQHAAVFGRALAQVLNVKLGALG